MRFGIGRRSGGSFVSSFPALTAIRRTATALSAFRAVTVSVAVPAAVALSKSVASLFPGTTETVVIFTSTFGLSPALRGTAAILSSTSNPRINWPKIVCLKSRLRVCVSVAKNCEPFVGSKFPSKIALPAVLPRA